MHAGDERISLHAHLHGILQNALAPALRDLFDELDTRLFNLAERSRSGIQQHMYFNALRLLRMERVTVETRFLQRADEALFAESEAASSTPRHGALQLLGKDEQEETLQLENQIQRISGHLGPTLATLLVRLASLAGHEPPADPLIHPISPRGLGRAFRQSMDGVDVNMEVRLITLGLFGQHVLQSLEPLYARLNAHLKQAGILPELADAPAPTLTPSFVPRPPRTPRPVPQADTQGTPASPDPARRPAPAPDGNEQRITQLRDLMDLYRQSAIPGATPQSVVTPEQPARPQLQRASPLLSREAMDSALDQLWTYDQDPLELKSQLLATACRVAQLDDGLPTSDDEDIIDMIGLLFARIRSDEALPEPMRKLLARMHLPFLRTALREPALLSGSTHPARELLDELGELAVGWCEAFDPGGAMVRQVALTVEQLAAHRHGVDASEYARACDGLNREMGAQLRRAELSEQRAIEALIGRERLELARTRVASLVRKRLDRCEPLPWIRQLLAGPWSHHLALVWLRHNETSAVFRDALDFVDELLWVDATSIGSEEDERLQNARDTLPERLRTGLDGITLHDREINDLVHRLDAFLQAHLGGHELPEFLYESDPTLMRVDFSAPWQDTDLDEQPPAESINPRLLSRLRTLAPGTWFEFRLPPQSEGENESRFERSRLCWTSPYTGRYLFVNRNGIKTHEMNAAELIPVLESGMARMIESQRLLERNLRSLIEQLRATIGQPGVASGSS